MDKAAAGAHQRADSGAPDSRQLGEGTKAMPAIVHSAGDTFASIVVDRYPGEGPGFAVLRLGLAGRQAHSELVRILPKLSRHQP
jgi:hypothetical protein